MQPAPHYKRDFYTQLFSSEFCRMFENILMFWSLLGECFDLFKLSKYMTLSFLLGFFYRKGKTDWKRVVKLGNLRFALQRSSSFVKLYTIHIIKHYTLKSFLRTNWKKYDSRKDLLHVSKCSTSARCHLCY